MQNNDNRNSELSQSDIEFGDNIPVQVATQQIIQKVGGPFIENNRGGYTINQSFFAENFGQKRPVIHDCASGRYYQYLPLNGLYQELRADTVRAAISDDIFAQASDYQVKGVGAKVTRHLQMSIEAMAKELISHDDFFARNPLEPPTIHVANGMLVFEKDGAMSLRPFGAAYRSRNQIPIAYDPAAQCQLLLDELLSPVLDPEDIELIQRYAGLILIGGNRAQKLLMLTGLGGTGKGTLVNLVTAIIGQKNVDQLRVDQLKQRFETSRLIGKMLLTVIEAPADFLNQDGAEIVKALVGHDEMKGERKNVNESLRVQGRYPILVTSNEELRVRLAGDESAWARRLLNVDYRRPRSNGSQIIDNFHEVLLCKEGPGILNWMIKGAVVHWQELQAKKGFGQSQQQTKRVENILLRSKSVEVFVTKELQPQPKSSLTVRELFSAYCRFCADRNWEPVPERRFEESSHRLILQFCSVPKSQDILYNGKSVRGYRSLGLRNY